ncbi:MAG: hypothetical protein AAFY76_15810 [Cyanobacteria bacterium J06649_11]
MNLTQNLEQFHNELSTALTIVENLKANYPTMFKEVLPDGEEIRMGDILQGLATAHDETRLSLDLIGTDLEID